jgi:hypothetical protein
MSDLSVLQSRAVASGNVRRYRAARELLIEELGGQCVDCGSTESLQFDHTVVRTWSARKTSRWVRIARYRREALAGVIALRCKVCNNSKGRPRKPLRAKDA